MEESLRADAWALKMIGQYEEGKLIKHAWLSRGLVTVENMAAWHFNGNHEALREHMSANQHGLRQLLRLEKAVEIDQVGSDQARERALCAEQATLPGEAQVAWAIAVDGGFAPLPAWCKNPISRSIALWQKEVDTWASRISNRRYFGKGELPPKQKLEYQKWQECKTRRIVLDRRRQGQILNLHASRMKELKKNCILLEIFMAECKDDLKIRSGEGHWFPLRMVEGVTPSSEMPVDLDVQPGLWGMECHRDR